MLRWYTCRCEMYGRAMSWSWWITRTNVASSVAGMTCLPKLRNISTVSQQWSFRHTTRYMSKQCNHQYYAVFSWVKLLTKTWEYPSCCNSKGLVEKLWIFPSNLRLAFLMFNIPECKGALGVILLYTFYGRLNKLPKRMVWLLCSWLLEPLVNQSSPVYNQYLLLKMIIKFSLHLLI